MDSFYLIIKDTHAYWRWIILVLAAIVLIKYLAGWFGKQKYAGLDKRLTTFFVISLDIQLLLGLLLYFFLSPATQDAFQSGANTMSDPAKRFYALEHPFTMLMAIVVAHIGSIMVRRAQSDDAKFKRGVLLFGLCLVLMLARMPW